jgi:hypothetical protein
MAITVELITQDVSIGLQWRSLSIQESIGQPDTLSVEMVEINDTIRTLLRPIDNYLYTAVRKNGALLFSGLATKLLRRNKKGVVTYTLQAVGWEYLAPKRLVGTPYTWGIPPEEEWGDALPTPFWDDPRATAEPDPGSIAQLWGAYWNFPGVDLTTFVADILPTGVEPWDSHIDWSGSDLDGAMNDLCAIGSAAAAWWLANDSPNPQSIVAPNLALHVALLTLPDEGDAGDDLGAGLPSADQPTNVAPYAISDVPDWVTSIMPVSAPEIAVDHGQRVDGSYVRGATGNTLDILPAPEGWPVPFQVGLEHEGGTGWVGSPGGIWGEAYVDAPAAISKAQRDAFGGAYLGAYGGPSITGTIPVVGYDGWHKGQAVQFTDTGLGFSARWLMIHSVSITANDPQGEALSYGLSVGDAMTAALGYALRKQRLADQRKEIAPASQFIPYMGDLQPEPGGTLVVRMQLASDSGSVRKVAGVGARWSLLINGEWSADPFDDSQLFWLSDATTTTNEIGQVTAKMHAAAGATPDADAANAKADVVL